MNTGYDTNSPNKYMQTAFDALKGNQPATQQAVSQGPQSGLRYLAGLQAQASQQQAQQAQPQTLPATTVLQQLLQKIGQNHGIMAQLPSSIDVASAPTQPPMATGGLVSLAAGGPVAFSGGGPTEIDPDFDASYNEPEEMTSGDSSGQRKPTYKTAIREIPNYSEEIGTAQEQQRLDKEYRERLKEHYKGQAEASSTPKEQIKPTARYNPDTGSYEYEGPDNMRARQIKAEQSGVPREPTGLQRRAEPYTDMMKQRQEYADKTISSGRERVTDLSQKSAARLDSQIAQQEELFQRQQQEAIRQREEAAAQRAARRATAQPGVQRTIEEQLAGQRARLTPRAEEFTVPRGSSGTGIMSKLGRVVNNPLTRGIAKKIPYLGYGLAAWELAGGSEGIGSLYDKAKGYLTEEKEPTSTSNSTATPFVGPVKPNEPVHAAVPKAEPPATAKQGVKAVNATEHAKQIERKAEAPKGQAPEDEKQYEFDQNRDEYRDDHQPPEAPPEAPPTQRSFTPQVPEDSGIGSVTPEDMIQHLQQLGGGYQEDPEIAQMRRDELESAKANKWAGSLAGLIGGIYGGHSPYASENVARGIMTALGQYQAGTQAEDVARHGIINASDIARKTQAASQQHALDKYLEMASAKAGRLGQDRRAMKEIESREYMAKQKLDQNLKLAEQRALQGLQASVPTMVQGSDKYVKAATAAIAAIFKNLEFQTSNSRTGRLSMDQLVALAQNTWTAAGMPGKLPENVISGISEAVSGGSGGSTAPKGSMSDQFSSDEE